MINNSIKYGEITHRFYNITVIFKILNFKNGKTILSFSIQKEPHEWLHYKVKENFDYSKKIVENTIKHFENIPIDSSDIDLCLRKAFSLCKFKPYLYWIS